ncbi:MAG: DUF465 domain-containing protein [Pseudomonadota bacterium]
MSEQGHDLHSAFPADGAILQALKVQDGHFRTLAGQYHDLTQEILRVESGLEAASDVRLEALKKQRLGMLDEVATLIEARKAA